MRLCQTQMSNLPKSFKCFCLKNRIWTVSESSVAALAQSSISFLLLRHIDSPAVDALMSIGVLHCGSGDPQLSQTFWWIHFWAWGYQNLDMASSMPQSQRLGQRCGSPATIPISRLAFTLLLAGQSERALPHLLRASRQALNDGRFALSIMASKQAYKAAQTFRSSHGLYRGAAYSPSKSDRCSK